MSLSGDRGRASPPLRSAAASLLLVFALGGCAASAVTGSLPAGMPATTDATPVDPQLVRTLEGAPAGTGFAYRLADGAEGSLVLGPLYQSVRGIPCRLGRAPPAAAGGGRPDSYPFCRFGDQWYAMKPVVISGY